MPSSGFACGCPGIYTHTPHEYIRNITRTHIHTYTYTHVYTRTRGGGEREKVNLNVSMYVEPRKSGGSRKGKSKDPQR